MRATGQPSNRRILVVDDNQAIHGDFRKILVGSAPAAADLGEMEEALFGRSDAAPVMESFELDSAYQGQEGLKLVQDSLRAGRPYALVFLDVRMPPGWDGVETAGHLWKADPSLQIVLCTAYSDYSWDETIKRLGQTDRLMILKKPFDSIEVRQMAHALTTKWDLLHLADSMLDNMERLVAERTSDVAAVNKRLLQEIEERKKAEVGLRHAQKLEAVGQLAAGIAHEINTPIQFIGDSVHFLRDAFGDIQGLLGKYQALCDKGGPIDKGALGAVREAAEEADLPYLEEQVPKAFERTQDGIERVATIVRAMKEFAHPSQKDKAPADVNRMITSTLTVARNEYKYVAEVHTELGQLPMVMCLPGDLNQVFLNLVVNAAHAIGDVVKGSSGKGTISVQTRKEGDFVVIDIGDTGGGIPESIRNRVYDPFFTTKEVGKGTGQGLAIARSIVVDKHGGALSFDTEEGRGTTFHIRLPIDGQPQRPPAPEQPA